MKEENLVIGMKYFDEKTRQCEPSKEKYVKNHIQD